MKEREGRKEKKEKGKTFQPNSISFISDSDTNFLQEPWFPILGFLSSFFPLAHSEHGYSIVTPPQIMQYRMDYDAQAKVSCQKLADLESSGNEQDDMGFGCKKGPDQDLFVGSRS